MLDSCSISLILLLGSSHPRGYVVCFEISVLLCLLSCFDVNLSPSAAAKERKPKTSERGEGSIAGNRREWEEYHCETDEDYSS